MFDITDMLRDSPQMEQCLKWMKEDLATAKMIEQRYMGVDYDLEAMLQMPQGSLGWTYAQVMTEINYDPKFYRLREIESDKDYVINRIRKTHDLHHILTGFSMDDYGEAGVLAVTVAQTVYPAWMIIDILAMLLDFFAGENERGIDVEYDFDVISAGINMGRAAKPLFPVQWEEYFELSLERLRADLKIKPVTEGKWSWYSRPNLRAAIGLEELVTV